MRTALDDTRRFSVFTAFCSSVFGPFESSAGQNRYGTNRFVRRM